MLKNYIYLYYNIYGQKSRQIHQKTKKTNRNKDFAFSPQNESDAIISGFYQILVSAHLMAICTKTKSRLLPSR